MIKARVSLEDMEGFDAQYDEVVDAITANLSEVADVVLAAAKTSTAFRDKTGNLRMSIRKRKSRFENGGFIIMARGSNKTGDKGYHAHLVEFGHVMIDHKGRVTKLGRVPAHPFMRPAKEQGIRKAIELFRSRK